ncbi:hypothetical protein [Chryseobacterium wanjuense]
MKYYFFILFIILFSCCKNNEEIIGSDEEIAVTLAERTWKDAYGKSEINEQKPFIAEKKMIVFGVCAELLTKPD